MDEHAIKEFGIAGDTYVDDGRERADAGLLDGEGPRRSVGVTGTGDEGGVIRADDHADEDGAEDVEERDAVGHTTRRLRDRAVRVLGLGGGDDYRLDTDETETGVDERRHEAEEVAGRPGDAVEVGPRAGVVPVLEAATVAVRRAAEGNDERDDDEAEEAGDLDDGRDDLCLSVEADGHEVDEKDQGETDGDDEGRGDVGPVRDDDGCRRDLGCDGDGVAVAVRKSCVGVGMSRVCGAGGGRDP